MPLRRIVWTLLALWFIAFYFVVGNFIWGRMSLALEAAGSLRGCENLSPGECAAFAEEQDK